MAKIVYIMGKSASGKDTIFHRLVNDDALSLHIIIGYTEVCRRFLAEEEDLRYIIQ